MGNCCGSESGNFKGEGQTLSAAPANAPPQSDNQRAAVPAKISAPQGQGRTLGRNPQAPDQSASAKEAAAKAAEVGASPASSSNRAKHQRLDSLSAFTMSALLLLTLDE